MKYSLLMFWFLLTAGFTDAQNHIVVTSKNTARVGGIYLINVPINYAQKKLIIYDDRGLVPLQAFYQESFRQDTIIYITRVYNEKKHTKILTRYTVEPEFSYTHQIDTAYDIDRKWLSIDTSKQIKAGPSQCLIYLVASNGERGCCSVHMRPDTTIIYHDIMVFKRKHKAPLGPVFSRVFGDEGEGGLYFTLSSLTLKQKAELLEQRRVSTYPAYALEKTPLVSMPFYLDTGKIRSFNMDRPVAADTQTVYTEVETYPGYPGGIGTFINEFYKKLNLRIGMLGEIDVQFIVERNGSLSHIEVHSRQVSEELQKKATDIIRNSKRWVPGKIGNKAVRVEFLIPFYQDY